MATKVFVYINDALVTVAWQPSCLYALITVARQLFYMHDALATAAWQHSCLYIYIYIYKQCFSNNCMATRLFICMML